MGRPPLVLLTALALAGALAGCGGEPAPTREPPAATGGAERPPGPPAIVFDTTEPPEVVVQIPKPEPDPPRPAVEPDPEPPPRPRPPRPRPPPPPPRGGPSGSCDVRATEGYCFAYTGAGWTPASARANCDGAPSATFGPGACPLADRIATCAFRRPSEPDREILYTYYAPADLLMAELACPGTFTVVEGAE